MKSVLFVCQGNICRSPALAAAVHHLAVQRGLADQIYADSCGLGWAHLGEHPDRRTFECAKKRGILIDHRAQQFQDEFFDVFDAIYVVNEEIGEQLKFRAKNDTHRSKIHLATRHSKRFQGQEIPDPYYMSLNGFDEVMDIALDCAQGLLDELFKKSSF